MSTNTTTATAENTAAEIVPVYRWGTAAIVNDKDGAATEFTAVRYEDGKKGYYTAAELTRGAVARCRSRSYAVVLAVDCAAARGDLVNDKTADAYPAALAAVRRDLRDATKKAADKAKEKADAAAAAYATAESDAAAALAKLNAAAVVAK